MSAMPEVMAAADAMPAGPEVDGPARRHDRAGQRDHYGWQPGKRRGAGDAAAGDSRPVSCQVRPQQQRGASGDQRQLQHAAHEVQCAAGSGLCRSGPNGRPTVRDATYTAMTIAFPVMPSQSQTRDAPDQDRWPDHLGPGDDHEEDAIQGVFREMLKRHCEMNGRGAGGGKLPPGRSEGTAGQLLTRCGRSCPRAQKCSCRASSVDPNAPGLLLPVMQAVVCPKGAAPAASPCWLMFPAAARRIRAGAFRVMLQQLTY